MFTLSDRSTEQTVKVHFMTQGEMTILKIYFLIILRYTNHVLANIECNPGEYTDKDTLIDSSRAFCLILHMICIILCVLNDRKNGLLSDFAAE